MRPGSVRPRERGFTIVELMVVVAIIGISASLAVMVNKSDPTAKAARQLASILSQARRLAVAHGASASAAITQTARVTVAEVAGHSVVKVWELNDAVSPAVWVQLEAATLPRGVRVARMATVANTVGGETLPSALADSAVAEMRFYPNGIAEARTFYLQTRNSSKPDKYRVFVLPLSGIATTTKGW